MKFTYYFIIGRSLSLLKGHVQNVKKYAGFDNLKCDKELLAIVYKNKKIPEKVTQEILDYCASQDVRTVIYDEPEENDFITNLYACWCLGYEEATGDCIFRGGSDQVFSKGSFQAVVDNVKEGRILQANTIENAENLKKIEAHSRHFVANFGSSFEEFNYEAFENVIAQIVAPIPENRPLVSIGDALALWGRPTKLGTSLGVIDRTDGCSWQMSKSDWEKFGPMEPIKDGITGDVLVHDRLQTAGYKSYILRDCFVYHFVRGESIDIQ